MKFNLLALILIAVMTIVPTGSGLGVEGVIFDAEVSPGQHVRHEIKVMLDHNEGPLDLSVDVEDWGQSQDGVNMGLPDRSNPYSACGFLRALPARFHLEPGQSQSVIVEGDIPQEVGSGGRYALVTIYGMPVDSPSEGLESSVGLAVAVTSLIRMTISGTELVRSGDFEVLNVQAPLSLDQRNISLIFNNTGNCHFKARAKCALLKEDGAIEAEFSSPLSSNIIPGAARIFQIDLDRGSLTSEICKINVTIEAEDGMLLAGQDIDV